MAKREPVAGEVWWCDGTALAFEPHFKNRPALIVAVESATAVYVVPLSSHRRYGQETMVTHAGGVSFMTGTIQLVPASALRKPLGNWSGFAAWQAEQQDIARSLSSPSLRERCTHFLQNLLDKLQRIRPR